MIKELNIKSLRGATQPLNIKFDTNKKISLIFGENGSGKSTIVDAIDFIANQKFGSIEDLSGIGKAEFISIGSNKEDVFVNAKIGSTDYVGKMNTAITVQAPLNHNNMPKISILRRSKILSLITAMPSERYEEIRKFIEIDNIRKNEDNLKKAVKNVSSTYDKYTKDIAINIGTLIEQAKKEGRLDWEIWIKEKLQSSIEEKKTYLFDLQKIEISIVSLNETKKSMDNYKTQSDLSFADFQAKTQEISSPEDLEKISFLEVFEKTLAFFEANPMTSKCPVCSNDIVLESLIAEINEKIKEMRMLKDKKNNMDFAKQKYDKDYTILMNATRKFLENMNDFFKLCKDSSLYEITNSGINWNGYICSQSDIDSPSPQVISKILEGLIAINNLNISIMQKIEKLKTEVEDYKLLENLYRNYENFLKESAKYQKMKVKAEALYNILFTERKKYEEQVLSSIENEINMLYSKIHLNENISFVKFKMDEQKIGSVYIHCKFEDQESENAYKYMSESHLDTLGICLFIALAKKDGSEILVLDDVLTSVDRIHLRRFADLVDSLVLGNGFKQIVLTTHVSDWQMFYKTNRNPVYKIDFIELNKWSKNGGISHTKTKPDIDTLKNLISSANIDRQIVSSKAGILLESLCNFFVDIYDISVPRRDLTLGDYKNAFSSSFLNSLKIEKNGASENIRKKIDDVLQDAWVRNNVGCHFKHESTIPDNEVRTFVNNTIVLAETIVCPICGQLPAKDACSFWKCSCPEETQIKLYPYKKP